MTAANDLLRFGPAIVLAVTVAWLALATRRTSHAIGSRSYGFGAGRRQRLTRLLFVGSIAGAVVALGSHAAGVASGPLAPLAGEAAGVRLAGLVLAVAGQILTLVAQGEMGRRWRVGVSKRAPDALVTTGLFGLSRNPVFLGMLTLTVGLTVAVPSSAMVALTLAFLLACEVQVRDEERFLERAFGPAYVAYRGRVRRWF